MWRELVILASLGLSITAFGIQTQIQKPLRFKPAPKPVSTSSCSNVKCMNVTQCPENQFLVYADLDTVCCNYCKDYAGKYITEKINNFNFERANLSFLLTIGLDDNCDWNYPDAQYCSPVLQCTSKSENDPLTCQYQWVNYYKQNCSWVKCPTYCSCPDGQFLVQANQQDRCCDMCLDYSSKFQHRQ